MLHLRFSFRHRQCRLFDFIIKCEHLFLSNIYSVDKLEKMDIETEEKYTEIIYRLMEYYPLFENAIEDGDDICEKVTSFLVEDLNDCYSMLQEL